MKFLHEDRDFQSLLSIVATEVGVGAALVEKDYWVTHVLWSLQRCKLDVWFKGGTSLSKGFGLLQRFSEDLDLKIEPGECPGLPPAPDWNRSGKKHVEAREAFCSGLERSLRVPGCSVERQATDDRQLVLDVKYASNLLGHLPPVIRPFVRLEIGSARVTPYVTRDIDSWVHARVRASGRESAFQDNCPRAVRCVHPLVTLLEKLEAISRRFARDDDPAEYVRHYEDASRIISSADSLPELEGGVARLVQELFASRDLKRTLAADDPAFAPDLGERIEEAHAATASLYWTDQRPLVDCSRLIRGWLRRNPIASAGS